jgi:mannose-6-phosphate isomerase-like protein (cupin superfamily)
MVPWLKQAFHTRLQQDSSQQQQHQQQLQQLDLDTQQHQQQQPDQQQLVLLQLLLPSELLTGELASCHAGHAQAVAQHLPWSTLGQSNTEGLTAATATHIDQDCVCRWLVGAQQAMHPHQHHSQQQQQQPVNSSAAVQAPAVSNGSAAAASSAGPTSSSEDAGNNSSSSTDAATLPALTTHQVLKRALSEVGAFQLPAQTNRLALLFGPHASPAVCLSFGVEVFEPGHVTPLHTHSSAHELFFVLAGRAVGVHGPGGRERVAMEVGDVAVFPPGVLHGVDNESDQQLYCLQVRVHVVQHFGVASGIVRSQTWHCIS